MANQPGVSHDEGLFTRLTDDGLWMLVQQYALSPEGKAMTQTLTTDTVNA